MPNGHFVSSVSRTEQLEQASFSAEFSQRQSQLGLVAEESQDYGLLIMELFQVNDVVCLYSVYTDFLTKTRTTMRRPFTGHQGRRVP